MMVAQQLYEGVQIGSELVGLITYMRTDSFTLANEALSEIRNQIKNLFGSDQLPAKPIFYKTKSKNVQEAHEAIRPTSVRHTPDDLKQYLSAEQFKLYTLIWKRTIACQMIHATIDTVAADLGAGPGNLFRANGSTIARPGFIQVYLEGRDDVKPGDDDEKMFRPVSVETTEWWICIALPGSPSIGLAMKVAKQSWRSAASRISRLK